MGQAVDFIGSTIYNFVSIIKSSFDVIKTIEIPSISNILRIVAALIILGVGVAALGIMMIPIIAGSVALGVMVVTLKKAVDVLNKIDFSVILSPVKSLIESLIDLSKVSSGLLDVSKAILSLSKSMAALTLVKLGSWFSGDPFSGLYKLASYSGELVAVAESLNTISNVGDAASASIDKIAKSVDTLAESLNELSITKLMALSGASLMMGTAEALNSISASTSSEAEKLQELIDLLKAGKISVYMDGKLVSKTIANEQNVVS
jgi:methyl-accepting chemotaxis protein